MYGEDICPVKRMLRGNKTSSFVEVKACLRIGKCLSVLISIGGCSRLHRIHQKEGAMNNGTVEDCHYIFSHFLS